MAGRVPGPGDGDQHGATTTAGWQVEFTFADGQQISQSWQADVTQTGATVRATSAEWNGRLAPGGSTAFGFIATWDGGNAQPEVRCTAG